MFKKSKRKPIVTKVPENLVTYNLERAVDAMKRLEKEHEYDFGREYDDILSICDFVKKEMQRNYNRHANLKCDWCHERFSGWRAFSRKCKHEVMAHPKESAELQARMFSTIMDGVSTILGLK